jgi:hypothetical protein
LPPVPLVPCTATEASGEPFEQTEDISMPGGTSYQSKTSLNHYFTQVLHKRLGTPRSRQLKKPPLHLHLQPNVGKTSLIGQTSVFVVVATPNYLFKVVTSKIFFGAVLHNHFSNQYELARISFVEGTY